MRFLILGQLEAFDDHGNPLALGGRKQRAVLAALLLRADGLVRKAELVEWLWPSGPPATADHTVEVYVSRLRRLLNLGADHLTTVSGGYRLRLDAVELDTETLDALLDRADAQERGNDAASAAATIAEALRLYRGPVLGDLADLGFGTLEVARLENLRLTLMERQADLELASGGGTDLVGRLEGQVATYPDRERLWELLMLAHCRAQNQAAALETFARARRYLADELGIDPGPALTDLHLRVLRQDPGLPAPLPGMAAGGKVSTRARSSRLGWLVPIALTALSLLVASSPSRPALPTGTQVQLVDIDSGRVSASLQATNVLQMLYADGTFWVLRGNQDHLAVSFVAVSEASGAVAREFGSPYADVGYFLVLPDAIWVSDYQHPQLARLDPVTGVVTERVELGGGPPPRFRGTSTGGEQLVLAGGDLWVGRTGEVAQVDLDTGQVVRRIPLPYEWGMVASRGRVWVARQDGVSWIDAVTGEVGPLAPLDRPQNLVAVGAGVWAADPYGSIYEISPDGRARQRSATPGLGRPVSLSRNALTVWHADGTDVVVAAGPGEGRRTYRLDEPVETLAAGTTKVAVATSQPSRPEAPAPDDRASGEVLRMAWSRSTGDPLDPALIDPTTNPWLVQLARLTCVQLFRIADNQAGAQPIPDLAVGLPTISADGLTYRFTVSSQHHFAPPVSRSVTAEDVRFTLERALAAEPRGTSSAASLLAEIQGTAHFLDRQARHVDGIRVSGDVLTLRLTRKVPDLLWRLSQPTFCVVPDGSPLPHGLVLPPVSAGPYYVSAHENGGTTVLARNANAARPAILTADTIVIDESVAPSAAATATTAGTIQHASYDDPSFSPSADVARGTGRTTYHASPLMGVSYLAFNAGRKPFSDPRARAAVAASLDRAALNADESAVPSSWLLPEGMFGNRTGHSQTSAAAPTSTFEGDHRRIQLPTGPLRLGYQDGCGSCAVDAQQVAARLAAAGLPVDLQPMTEITAGSLAAASDLDLAIGQTRLAYPDPATFLTTMLGRNVPASWLTDDVRRRIQHLGSLTGQSRTQEALQLANELTDETPVAVYGTAVMGELVSALTCPQIRGAGLDLGRCLLE